jgi:hypothetical protein
MSNGQKHIPTPNEVFNKEIPSPEDVFGVKKKDDQLEPSLDTSSTTELPLQKVDQILQSNKDKNFVQRILDPTTARPLDRGDGTTSTHSMAWGEADGKYYVYPTVVEQNGELVDISDKDPLGYALKNNEYIEFDSAEEASAFSGDSGYKQRLGVESAKITGGELGATATVGADLAEIPVLKAAAEKSPWLAAPINALTRLTTGANKTFMPLLDASERLFYKGIGTLMTQTHSPMVQEAGAKLIAEQDSKKTWWKQAEELVDEYQKEKMPSPIMDDAASRLVGSLFEFLPFLATLYVTPNAAVGGVSAKLPLNFFAQNTLKEYSESGEGLPALAEGAKSVPEAMAIQMIGLPSKVVGSAVGRSVSNVIGKDAASAVGAGSAAATLGGAGYAHSVASQYAHTGEVDWEQAADDGVFWTMFGVPNMLSAAASVYHQAPREAIESSRGFNVKAKDIRKSADKIIGEAKKEKDQNKKIEKLIDASMRHKLADLKSMDEFYGKHPEESLKKIKEMDAPEAEKKMMSDKIEDAALRAEYEVQREKEKQAAEKEIAERVAKEPEKEIVLEEKPAAVEKAMRAKLEKEKGEIPPPEPSELSGSGALDWIDKKWHKYMNARGLIPRSMFNNWIRSEGGVKKKMYEIEETQRNFKKALKEAYGKTLLGKPKVDKETLTLMNDALSSMGEGEAGKAALKQFPEKVQESLIDMRHQVDALSREMVRSGMVEGELEAKFTENLGYYLTRTYKAHNDKNWKWRKIPEEITNRAISYLKSEYPQFTEEQIESRLKSWLYSQDMPMGYLKKAQMGSKDLGILKGRKDIPVELRNLLGEYKDPLYNYSTSVYKMADLIAKDKFLKQTLADGQGKFIFNEPTGDHVAQIAAAGSSVMEPLNGKFTTPELKEALERFNGTNPLTAFGQGYMYINSAVKYGKTILSPQTHVRNYLSNFMFHLANGRVFTGKAKSLVSFNYKNKKDPKYQEDVKRMIELGVIRDNARAGEIFDVIKDSYKEFNDLEKATDTFFKKPFKKTGKAFTDLYQIEDDVHKIYAYKVEKERYESVMKERYPEMSEKELNAMAEEAAAEIVRSTMPTYSLVPEVLKQVRRLPIVGTFVSFPAEVMRTTWNTADLATREMKDPSTRDIGIKRMSGFLTAATATAAAAAASKAIVGMNHKDDNDLRRFMPSWSEDSDLLFVRRPKDSVYTYVDLGYSDPFNYIKKGVNSFLNNSNKPVEGVIDMVIEMSEPFLGEELLASKIVDVRRNSKGETGGRIFNPESPPGDQAVDILRYMWDGVKPGVLSSAERISKGARKKVEGSREYNLAEELAAVGFGQRITKINVGESFMFKTKDYRDAIADAKFIYTKLLRSTSPDITEKDKEAAYETANNVLEEIVLNAHEDYKAALRLGVSKRKLKTHISQMRGVGDSVKGMIIKGRFEPINEKTGTW